MTGMIIACPERATAYEPISASGSAGYSRRNSSTSRMRPGVAMGEGERRQASVGIEQVDRTPVGDAGHDQVGDLAQRRRAVQRRPQDAARVGEVCREGHIVGVAQRRDTWISRERAWLVGGSSGEGCAVKAPRHDLGWRAPRRVAQTPTLRPALLHAAGSSSALRGGLRRRAVHESEDCNGVTTRPSSARG
jgi:hypothetical protein